MAKGTLEIEFLRAEINRHLDLFAQKGVTSVELDRDLYWSMGWEEGYIEGGEPPPTELMVGSLFDDLDSVLKGSEDEPVALMLCHMAPLLNFLGVKAGDRGVF